MDNGSAFGEGSWIFGLIVLLGLFGGFGGGFGNNNAAMAGFATMSDVNSAINNQTVTNSLGQIALSSQNNNYETAQLINNQTAAMMATQNNNLVNAIQGFNQISSNLNNGFANVSSQIADLGYKMESCCCGIKTMMLENRLQDTQADLLASRNANAIFAQNQYLLSQLGTYTPAAVV
jgi:hypothetical protein